MARVASSHRDASRFWFAWAVNQNPKVQRDLAEKLKAPYSTLIANWLVNKRSDLPPRYRPIIMLEAALYALRQREWEKALEVAKMIGKNPETMREAQLIRARALLGLKRLRPALDSYLALCNWSGLRDRAQVGVAACAFALEKRGEKIEPEKVDEALSNSLLSNVWKHRRSSQGLDVDAIVSALRKQLSDFSEQLPLEDLESAITSAK